MAVCSRPQGDARLSLSGDDVALADDQRTALRVACAFDSIVVDNDNDADTNNTDDDGDDDGSSRPMTAPVVLLLSWHWIAIDDDGERHDALRRRQCVVVVAHRSSDRSRRVSVLGGELPLH